MLNFRLIALSMLLPGLATVFLDLESFPRSAMAADLNVECFEKEIDWLSEGDPVAPTRGNKDLVFPASLAEEFGIQTSDTARILRQYLHHRPDGTMWIEDRLVNLKTGAQVDSFSRRVSNMRELKSALRAVFDRRMRWADEVLREGRLLKHDESLSQEEKLAVLEIHHLGDLPYSHDVKMGKARGLYRKLNNRDRVQLLLDVGVAGQADPTYPVPSISAKLLEAPKEQPRAFDFSSFEGVSNRSNGVDHPQELGLAFKHPAGLAYVRARNGAQGVTVEAIDIPRRIRNFLANLESTPAGEIHWENLFLLWNTIFPDRGASDIPRMRQLGIELQEWDPSQYANLRQRVL